MLIEIALKLVAWSATRLAITRYVSQTIVAAVDASRFRLLATEHASSLDDFLELLQGQRESQMALRGRLVPILVVNGLRGTDAAC